jgi:hypothetical protein
MVSKEQQENNLRAFQAMMAAVSPNRVEAKFTISTTYTLASIVPVNNDWYYAVQCLKCESITPFLSDASNGKRGIPFIGDGKICVNCALCLSQVESGVEGISTLQWS